MENQLCPICHSNVNFSSRYPNYVCTDCFEKASSKEGKLLDFNNTSLSGGFEATYKENKKPYKDTHLCFINGIKCWADEAYMGGIIIETYLPIMCPNISSVKNNIKKILLRLETSKNSMNYYFENDPFEFFYRMKFEKIGIEPLSSGNNPDNIFEQINQSFSGIVTFMGIEYLMEKFGEQIFYINLQSTNGLDIFTKDNNIVAEAFATVHESNNDKLNKEIKKISEIKSKFKFIFYYSHEATDKKEIIKNDITIINFSKRELELAKMDLV